MCHPRRVSRFFHCLFIVALLFNAVPPALYAQDSIYLPLVTSGQNAPTAHLLFRTRVTVQTPAQWRDLARLDALILDKGADWARLLVTDHQLTDLARLRYNPEQTNALGTLAAANISLRSAPGLQRLLLLEQQNRQSQAVQPAGQDSQTEQALYATMQSALHSLSADETTMLAQAVGADSDNDGLSDDQEGFWCTDLTRADSDFDGTKDGAEVSALKAWFGNQRAQFPSTGKPFQGWPPQKQNCFDDDQDAVPDLAEALELGLNPSRESTDRDKFDDGQELFGQTYCTGQGGFCSYGPLPRNEDWGVIFAEMPSWVKAPGNHPLVAGFPVPEIDVVESSLKVDVVTTVTTDHTINEGTEKSYATTETNGVSSSQANTELWNEWQEVNEEIQERVPVQAATTFEMGRRGRGPQRTNVAESSSLDIPVECGVNAFYGEATISYAPVGLGGSGTVGGSRTQLEGGAVYFCELAINRKIQEFPEKKEEYLNYLASVKNNHSVTITNTNIFTAINVIDFDTENIVNGLERLGLTYRETGELIGSAIYRIGSLLAQPVKITGSTNGRSRGGMQTLEHTEYTEHAITNGEAFSASESWGTATAIDSAHAADLWFSYKVRNTGTEYAREIANLAFNLYIGDDPNPTYTYFVAPDIGGNGKLQNFMPNEEHPYTSRRIPVSLEQMKAIDLGGPLRIVVEDFTYGIDELFYQDAANASVQVAIEDGTDDGDESIDTYLIPTWGQETVLNVLARYFPHETDADGTIIAIWTPEYRTDTPAWCQSPRRPTDFPNKALWCRHTLSTADWWNVYTDGLGDGSDGFQSTPAAPGSVALFRFNQDGDLDGFSDRSEARLGTDPNDAASFPHPELLAGLHNIKASNKVTSTLSLLNTGIYDAYGVEAVMVAPDDSISITNNTVGGSGRVRALKQVIVGSSLKLPSPLPGNWAQAGHAVPAVGGYYTGDEDRTYSFVVACGAVAGCAVGSGAWSVNWSDSKGATGQLNFGTNYQSPNFLPVGNLGVTLALYSGKVSNGESIAVTARTPRDTFQYTINREPYTPPLVIVSYNDPQGNHRFVIPTQAMSLTAPTDNLNQFTGEMLHDVGVEIVTSAPFAAGANSAKLLVNNPSDKTLSNARLFLEVINISGPVVAEIPSQVTLPPGPTYTTVNFNSNSFNPSYQVSEDYIVMAFLTDYQGNILDTAGRPLSSFQIDPLPKLVADDSSLTWNFGIAAQGTLMKHTTALANNGFGRLYTYVNPVAGLSAGNSGSNTIGAADTFPLPFTLRTDDLPLGSYDQTFTIATSDVDAPTHHLRVIGTITSAPVIASTVLGPNTTTIEFVLPEPVESLQNLKTVATSQEDTGWIDLLENGGFETGNLTGWATNSGSWFITSDGPRSGSKSVWKQGTSSTAQYASISQSRSVGQWRNEIDSGRGQARVGIWQWNQAGAATDNGRLVVRYRNGATVLAQYDSGFVNSQAGYALLQDERVIPSGVDNIELEFVTKRDSQSYNDVAADDAFMQVQMFDPTPTPTPTLTPTPTPTATPSVATMIRYVRLTANPHSQFLLDFTVSANGAAMVTLDIGDNGSVDWSAPSPALAPIRWKTGDLKGVLNAYLSGRSGEVDVPIRFSVSPAGSVKLNDYTAIPVAQTDLVADTITVGNQAMQAASAQSNEGDILLVQATLRNASATDSGPVTAAFFANALGWGDWYIGSALLNNIPANGSASISSQWNTTGFGNDKPVTVKVVVNPYGRLGESNLTNNSKTTSIPVTPTKTTQTITFAPLADRNVGDAPFAVTVSASSGLAVSLTALTPAVCTVSGTTVTLAAAGLCTLRAEQAGNAFFYAAGVVDRTFSVNDPQKLTQTIQFPAIGQRKLNESPITLVASASSGLTVSFTSATEAICTVNGNQVTLLAVGTCTLVARQPGDNQYNPAISEQSFQIIPNDKLDQSISFNPLPDKTYLDAPFGVSGTASSGLTVSFAALTTSVCTSNGNTITLVGAGLCTIRAVQTGDATYNPAVAVERTFTVHKANQSILFGSLSDKLTTDDPFAISASASSGLAVEFTTQTPLVCTIAGDVVTLLDKGLCTMRTAQLGNDNYNAASSLEQSFVVRNPALTNQAITFDPLPDVQLGDAPLTLTATASSGLAVTFVSQTPAVCTIEGVTVTLLAAGLCTIQATQVGNDRFNPATPVTRTFQVAPVGSENHSLYLPVVER